MMLRLLVMCILDKEIVETERDRDIERKRERVM